MSSRRCRDRSRSPPPASDWRDRSPSSESTGRSGRHLAYRQRDDYDDESEQHGYDNNNQPHGYPHVHTQITGQNAVVTIYNYNYHGAPPENAPWGYQPPVDPQVGNSGRHSRMLQWPTRAPLEAGSSSQSEKPERQIPEKMRDNCGACRKDHDIRFCPYPNTEDGRTKICPVCDTSKHAWYQCVHYDEKDTQLQWGVCWVNRRGLPTLVHDQSLHGIFLTKLDLEDEETPFESRLRALNTQAGPLSPAFVKRLLPPEGSDFCVQQQLRAGRRLPWQLDREILESPMDRPDQAIEDPATRDMQVGNFIPDTKTSYVPKAGKQKYFQSLDRKKRNGEDI